MLARPALLAAVIATAAGGAGQAQVPAKLAYPMEMRFDVGVASHDGTRLSVDVYRPLDAGRYPTVFQLTPYNNNDPGTAEQAWHFVERGYAFVAADLRGRYDSDGDFDPFRNDMLDGAAIMSWIADQPWSDEQVATMGGSYLGMDQWLMARADHPAHVAMMPYVAPADGFLDLVRFNGVPKVDLIYTWAMGMYGRVNQPSDGFVWSEVVKGLPLSELDAASGRRARFWRDWMEHDRMDEYWEPFTMQDHYQDFDIPSFNVTGWWDGQLLGATKSYEGAVATGRADDHVLIIGPWLHGVNRDRVIGDRDYGPDAIIDLDGIRDEWLDHQLRGGSSPGLANVRYFLQGVNEWRSADVWPLPETRFTSFYLDSGGNANTLNGDGVLRQGRPGSGPPDGFSYDPMNPVPTVSSRTSGARGGIAQGSVDNREVEGRQDVLVYTSEPLAQGVEVTGPRDGNRLLLHRCARHRHHGEAAGRRPRRTGSQPDPRDRAGALPQLLRESGATGARRGP